MSQLQESPQLQTFMKSSISTIPPPLHPQYLGKREEQYAAVFENAIAQGVMLSSDYTRRMVKYLQSGMSLDNARERTEAKTPLGRIRLRLLFDTPSGDVE